MAIIKKKAAAQKNEPQQDIMGIAHQFTDFLFVHKKKITVAILACVAIAVIAGGYAIMRAMQEQKAAPMLAQAYEFYAGANGKADYPKALTLFTELNTKYPRTTSGAIAQYYIGNCLVGMGKTEDAVKEYQKFLSNYSGDKFVLGLVYQRLGYAYSNLGKQTEAIQAFEQAEKLNGPGAATIEAARLYEAAGNTAEAQKKYKLIVEKLGGTMWAMEAIAKSPQVPMVLPKEGKTK